VGTRRLQGIKRKGRYGGFPKRANTTGNRETFKAEKEEKHERKSEKKIFVKQSPGSKQHTRLIAGRRMRKGADTSVNTETNEGRSQREGKIQFGNEGREERQ